MSQKVQKLAFFNEHVLLFFLAVLFQFVKREAIFNRKKNVLESERPLHS